ncbi:uncharacterized protein BDW70DRAFT_146025 [Aspergillus foveolatus]|uniref:uncharacterized protein n=1 Tax=Aspergillus foveolatus TaxID=210207 RepID=UPI003CCDA5F6
MPFHARLARGLGSAFLLFRQTRHAGYIHSAVVRMVKAPPTKHVDVSRYVESLMATRLADFEALPTTSRGTSVVVMLVVGMGADTAKSTLTGAGRHSTSIDCLKKSGCLLDRNRMRCFVSSQPHSLP